MGADQDDTGRPARVEVLADADRPGGFLLLVDRVRQSYVDLDDPTYLDFLYMQWFADVLDTLPDGPLAVTHIGGGAAAMPRWLDARRPGGTHIVFEPDAEVIAVLRARLPFARGAHIRIRELLGRPGVAGLRAASADVVILDAFAGARVPADLGTEEFFTDVARVLRPGGLLLANVGDGGPLVYTKRLAAGLRAAVGPVGVISEKRVFGGARFGNVVLAAGTALDTAAIRRNLARGVIPAQLRYGRVLTEWLAGAVPFTDADSARSPSPPESSWRLPL